MSFDLSQILANAHSQDVSVRAPAEKALKEFENKNLPQYLVALCQVLANEKQRLELRQLAGLTLKNTLVTKDEKKRTELAQRWLALKDEIRQTIRRMVLQILAVNEKAARSTAALIIGKIAAIEIPNKGWPDLVDGLVASIRKSDNANLRQSALETLGYVCEECPDFLQEKSSLILTAIATGMKPEEKNEAIRLAATTALANSLEFARKNFSVERERNWIMQLIFHTSKSAEPKVRVAAYQCLVEIASSYYEYIGAYMPHIFLLTAGAIKSENEEVGLQAIEFWSTICDEEIDIQEEIAEAKRKHTAPKRTCQNLATKALENLMPLVLECLTKQSEELDDDTWNKATAAGTCLNLMAQTTGDACVKHVLPFVSKHIRNTNWRYKEAATLAFGCILDGPDHKNLAPIVTQAFPVILAQMKDTSPLVKDTAAWTIGRICSVLPETITDKNLDILMQTLLAGLKEAPKIANNVCWAIHNLGENVEPTDRTSPLSKYFLDLMGGLLKTTERADVHEANLLTTSYEAINILIQTAAPDVFPIIEKIIPTLMHRLKNTLTSQGVAPGAAEGQLEVQGLLCAALNVILQKSEQSVFDKYGNLITELFISVLNAKSHTVLEEAMMGLTPICNRLQSQFFAFLPRIKPALVKGLQAVDQVHLCTITTGVVGDVARAIEGKFVMVSDEIMKILLGNLQNSQIDRSIKPHIISCMGDIALAIGGHFQRYLPHAMNMLVGASLIKFEDMDADNIEYLNLLREAIIECYTAILNALTPDGKGSLMLGWVDKISKFFEILAGDNNRTDALLKGTIALIGDLSSHLRAPVKQFINRPYVAHLLQLSLRSDNDETKKAAEYAKSMVEQLMTSSAS